MEKRNVYNKTFLIKIGWHYRISSHGRVINVKTLKFVKGFFHKSRSGYYKRFELTNNSNSSQKIMAHILVIETFD